MVVICIDRDDLALYRCPRRGHGRTMALFVTSPILWHILRHILAVPFYVFPCCQPPRLETVSPITWQRVLQRGHNVAVSPYGSLGGEGCQYTPGFSDSTGILVRKRATLWLKPPML